MAVIFWTIGLCLACVQIYAHNQVKSIYLQFIECIQTELDLNSNTNPKCESVSILHQMHTTNHPSPSFTAYNLFKLR